MNRPTLFTVAALVAVIALQAIALVNQWSAPEGSCAVQIRQCRAKDLVPTIRETPAGYEFVCGRGR